MSHRVLVVGNRAREQVLAFRMARDADDNIVRDVLVKKKLLRALTILFRMSRLRVQSIFEI